MTRIKSRRAPGWRPQAGPRKRAPSARPEEALHVLVADYLAQCLPPAPAGPWWTHPHNEGLRTGRDAGRARRMGQRPGTPDLLMVWRGGLIGIELKSVNGRLSDAQVAAHEHLRACGAAVHVCRSLDDVMAVLDQHGVPVRARPLGGMPRHADQMCWAPGRAGRQQEDEA